MRLSEREFRKRIRKLEEAEDRTESAFVTVTRHDGSQARLLWCNALQEALEGQIEAVNADNELSGLVAAMLL